MSANSKIEWTDHTFNPWIGCTKVSPGCANCYAERSEDLRWHRVKWGKGQPRLRTSDANWRQPLKWNQIGKDYPALCLDCMVRFRDAENLAIPYLCPACHGRLSYQRQRVFCASLADWLDDEVETEWRVNLLQVIYATPNLDWLLLTKRPENWQKLLSDAFQFAVDHGDEESDSQMAFTDWLGGWCHAYIPPNHVWIGTTVEDQVRANERIPKVLEIPAKVRFLSCEPLLGAIDLRLTYNGHSLSRRIADDLHWVIGGGESGKHARPMHPQYAESLRDQCVAAGVPFFFKQWGEYAPSIFGSGPTPDHLPDSAGYYFEEPHPPGKVWRFGKKVAGRLLDGVEHNGFPIFPQEAP